MARDFRTIRSRVWGLLRSRRIRMRLIAAVACVAAVLSVVVAARLSQEAVTLTHPELVLMCPNDGKGAHTHDESCYDEDGFLVCPLEERELHTHDESCYDEAGTLVCGKEELTTAHVHGPGCFADASTIPMPAQRFSDAAGAVMVRVDAPEGAFPEKTTMDVAAVDDESVREAVEALRADPAVGNRPLYFFTTGAMALSDARKEVEEA